MLFLIAGGYAIAALVCQTFDEINDFGRRFCRNKNQKRLAHAEQFAHLLHVAVVNETNVYKVTLLLLRLLRQDVTVESVLSLDLTGSGERETLLSTRISLYFRHLFVN